MFGLGLFTLSDNWIAAAFTHQSAMPAWLGGIAVFLLSLYLALFPAFAALAAWLMARRFWPGCQAIAASPQAIGIDPLASAVMTLSLAACWIVTEWIRSWLFTGFAWNPVGVVLLGGFSTRGLAIVAPFVGSYALSGLLVLLSGMPSFFMRVAASRSGAWRWLAVGVPVIVLGALTALMLLPDPWAENRPGGIRYTLVQPNLAQELLDDPSQFEANFEKLARLSLPSRPGEKRVVFWPESGVSDYLRDGYPDYMYEGFTYADDPAIARWRIGQIIGPYGVLMTGAVDLVTKGEEVLAARNSVTMLDGQGDILAGYSKAHLVPYGEYLPMRWLLEPLGLSRLVAGDIDFVPGPGPRTFDLGDYGKAGVQICYEIVFSGEIVDPENRPDYIFNPSNDGWFGTWGPPQHLAQARLRAIEEGLPILRSTTTGISAVIDADGIVRAYVPQHEARRLDGFIPLPKAATLFAKFGNAIPLTIAGLLAFLAVSVVALKRRSA